ncbi:MBL fold metallo-hydrolase [Variovorax sp. J2P1-59]|uniref:MBL fold metallo-hydrolase n=1 Tax=Variovorax flavidus TaxID=3053501 RepID=UPI00257546A7|nr:MBL fold metallo-hydrolase [Variovorax sp. J2P1-59]MDM0078402.1 MBL fold metallo-hydrolase [Variovorax sp. J2P1-59]
MTNRSSIRPLAGACALAAILSGCAQPASQSTVSAHVAAATQAAGTDLQPLLVLCKPAPATRPPQAESDRGIAALMNKPPPPQGQAFDNLYYVGADWVSAWAIKTSDGIILIDALNNEAEATALIDGGMRKLGLDPAQIKYVIVTHGHGDHYGGAKYLVQKYRPRIVMSEVDWKMTETQLEFTTPLWGAPPQRDMAVKDGDRITLGDTTVTLYLTPGHTMGTITPVFDVKSGNRTYRTLLWGGTAFNFGKDIPRLDSYIQSTQRMSTVAKEQKVDVLLSNHAGYDNALPRLEALRQQPGLQPNPFVIGNEAVLRGLTVMNECARAQRDRFTLQ